MKTSRVVVWFSCGSASAIALKLAVKKYGRKNINAVYCDTGSEHKSNAVFLKEIEDWVGIDVEILKHKRYVNIYDVFIHRRFIKGITGSPCTQLLKKRMREKYQKKDDIQIFGYTLDETVRANKFKERFPEVNEDFILIDQKLTKQECTGLIWRAGIKLPYMYELGYNHNNCIGCVKGGRGYWNKIRKDFPEEFEKMSQVEQIIGHSILRSNPPENKPIFLKDLDPNDGKYKEEPAITCGFDCELAYQDMEK